MGKQTIKAKENTRHMVQAKAAKKVQGPNLAIQLKDNRSSAVVQRQLQEMADNSPGVLKMKAMQQMADTSVLTN